NQCAKAPGATVLTPMGIPIFQVAGGTDLADFDVLDPNLLQYQAVRRPQVKLYPRMAVTCCQEGLGERAKGLFYLSSHFLPNRVVVWANRRPNGSQQRLRTAVISRLHGIHCSS